MDGECTPRYQAWLDAGCPEGHFPIWVRQQWRLYFTEVEGREPGANTHLERGVMVDTAEEELPFFVLGHQDEFDGWLSARVLLGVYGEPPRLADEDTLVGIGGSSSHDL